MSTDPTPHPSAAPKVKLPSIAELTNHLPTASHDGLPLLLIFRAPVPPVGRLPLALTDQLAAVTPGPYNSQFARQSGFMSGFHRPSHPPQYQYYSYTNVPPPPGPYQHSFYNQMYYSPLAGGASANYVHLPPTKPYSVAEVINKPMKKCHRCGTTETPEWRRGPNGSRTLCNACGLFHAKLVKRKGAALAAEEVLNNKVCKGKNGRRVSLKKKAMDESKKRMCEAQVTEVPPIPYPATSAVAAPPQQAIPGPPAPHHQTHLPSAPGNEYLYRMLPSTGSVSLPGMQWGPQLASTRPVLSTPHQSLPPLRN